MNTIIIMPALAVTALKMIPQEGVRIAESELGVYGYSLRPVIALQCRRANAYY